MNILHYGLGFPPYRSGGLTVFTIDLMQQQLRDGHVVSLLWPGKYTCINTRTKIINRGLVSGVVSYEVLNPNPIPYDEGILDVRPYINDGDVLYYQSFLKELSLDVIHVQSLMGIQKNFIVAARNLGIKVVFTAHDFFPICPKVTMFRSGEICSTVDDCRLCESCNSTALSINKIKMLQSDIYRRIKDNYLVSKIRVNHRNGFNEKNAEWYELTESEEGAAQYRYLRLYYDSILKLMDVVHYNSNNTKKIFLQYMSEYQSIVLPITHSRIGDNRRIKKFTDKIRMTYLGPYGAAKGFFELKNTLDKLWLVKKEFCLNIYFDMKDAPDYVYTHSKYTLDELKDIFMETDVLIVPSVWYETFGFTVIEALSYGVPVIVSENVGAKDIIPPGAGIVYGLENDELYKILFGLNKMNLKKMNESICEGEAMMGIEQLSHLYEKNLYIIN